MYKYFTFWVLTVNILYLFGYLKNFYSSILFLNIIVIVGTTVILIKYKWKLDVMIHKKKMIVKDNLYRLVHFFAHYFFFRLITKTFYDHQDTYVAENNQVGDFVAYFCAALLLNWSADLKALDFQGIIVFLQRLPTDNWTLVEVSNSQLTAVFCSRILTLPHPHT